MAKKVDALQAQAAELEGLEGQASLGPLGRLVGKEARYLLKICRNLGREAQAQSEYLAQMKQTMSNEKGLINAAMQTTDACTMFYQLLSLFKESDPDVKYKVQAACQLMRVGLVNIIVNLRAKGGSNEIAKRIEKLKADALEKIEQIEAAAAKEIAADRRAAQPAKKPGAGGLNLIVQKRNAADVVVKRRRALEEAEEEVKRLNRAAARRF
jgi:hypothetical protein